MKNIHIIGIKARDLAFSGADKVASAVEMSLGPAGQNLLMEKGNTTTNDGKKISQFLSTSMDNEFERRGALYQHAGSVEVEKQVKDSTSTYFTLSKGIRKALLPYLPTEAIPIGTPVSELKRRLLNEKDEVLSKLKDKTKKIESREELIKSALVSVEDEELAEMIGGMQWDLYQATGDGFIRPEETAELHSSIERTTGIYMDNGFATALLINNPEKESLEAENINVMLTNYIINDITPLTGLLVDLKKSGKTTLAIFARAFSQEAMKQTSEWAMKGMAIVPINAPYMNQSQVFLDLAAVTGANYVTDETKGLELINTADIGFSKRISCGRNESFISGSGDDKEKQRIEERIKTLERELEATNSMFYKDTLRQRIAGLKGAFAILRVGSLSPEDRKRKFDKCEDAVGAVRNALNSGTVKGAGIAFKEIADELPSDYILKEPLQAVYKQIKNSLPDGTEIPEWVRDPYISLATALEFAIEYSLNMANILGQDVTKNPTECNHAPQN